MWADTLMGMQHRVYRDDPWLRALYQQAGGKLDQLERDLTALHENRFIDGMTFALPVWERILGIRPAAGQPETERCAVVRAKWLTARKSDRALLQAIADAWHPGAVTVGFEAGFIAVSVLGDRDLPPDLSRMLAQIDTAKPAHLPVKTTMRWPYESGQRVACAVHVAQTIRID